MVLYITDYCIIILEGAQKSGHASNNKETEQRIGDWLRRAKERNLRAQIKKNGN